MNESPKARYDRQIKALDLRYANVMASVSAAAFHSAKDAMEEMINSVAVEGVQTELKRLWKDVQGCEQHYIGKNFTRREDVKSYDEWGGKQKAIVRKLATRSFKGKQVECALTLPGHSCLDIKAAFDSGLFNEASRIVAIERDDLTFEIIKSVLSLYSDNFLVKHENFADINFAELLEPKKVFDYVFLDLCNNPTADVIAKLSTLSKHISDDCRVCLTFSVWSKEMRWHRIVEKIYDDVDVGRVQSMVKNTRIRKKAALLISLIEDALATENNAFKCDNATVYSDTYPMIYLEFSGQKEKIGNSNRLVRAMLQYYKDSKSPFLNVENFLQQVGQISDPVRIRKLSFIAKKAILSRKINDSRR